MKTILIAFLSNFLIAASKFVGFLFTQSASMLSEAIHSFADCGNQILLFIGNKRSSKQNDKKFNFGYGREEFLWSFLVAIILFSFGAIFSIIEGIKHVLKPEKLENLPVLLIILAIGILMEGYSLSHALKEANTDKNFKKFGLIKYIKRTSNASNIVVMIEDFAAIIGLSSSFLFILLSYFLNPIFDGIGAIITGLILGSLSIFLAIELSNLIKGESLTEQETFNLKKLILNKKCVENINGVYSTIIGNNKYLIIISVDPYDFDNGINIEKISENIEKLVLNIYPDSSVFIDFRKKE